MKRWFYFILIAGVWLLLNQDAQAAIDTSPTSKESSYLDSDFKQGWAQLPQSETRTHLSSSSVYTPSLVYKVAILVKDFHFEQRTLLLEQKEKILHRSHTDARGFTDIQRIFPFHQFW